MSGEFDYSPPTIHIDVPKSKGFDVHGITMDDIALLVTINLDEISQAAIYFEQHRNEVFTQDGLTQFIIIMSRSFPLLCAEVLATASDMWGTPQQMRTLPAGVQLRALAEVFKLTLEDLGGLKNLLGLLAPIVRGALRGADMRTALKTDPKIGSEDSSTASEDK